MYAGTLPLDKHINKSQALVLWFKQNPEFDGKFVIFDDDKCEGFESTTDYNINKNFILTDPEWGLTNDDVEKAVEILNS